MFACRIKDDTVDFISLYAAIVHYTGHVTWLMPRIYVTACLLHLENFPWDHQECNLTFASWTMDGSRLDLSAEELALDFSHYVESSEWTLLSAHAHRVLKKYPCCQNLFPNLIYSFKLRRKQGYYIINFVLPIGCILGNSVLVFLVPPESGEQVAMSVTLLLSSTVFLSVVVDMLPVQSESQPLLGKSLCLLSCSVMKVNMDSLQDGSAVW